MGKFNSDDHSIYYWGQESLTRNAVTLKVNKRVQNAVLGCNLKNNRMISVCFQGKPLNMQFSSVAQSCPTLCDPMNRSTPGLPVHHHLLEFTQTHIHRVSDPSSHLILGRPLLFLPPIPPSIRLFSNESTLRMRWPKYWSFSFSIIPSKEHPGLISFIQSMKFSRPEYWSG